MNGEPTPRTFTGLGVALATPFTPGTESGAKKSPPSAGPPPRPTVDLRAFTRLVRRSVQHGVDYLVVLGSTGEAATVSDTERRTLVRAAVAASGTAPVVVGVGHQDTERTMTMARWAVTDGADGLLVVTPYYNRPQPAGLLAHYAAVAQAAPGTPIIAYNVPSRTGTNLTPEVMRELWQIPEVVAVKESSGDLRQIATVCRQAPAGRAVLAGDDDLALPAIAVGAQGLISVCANVAPRQIGTLVRAARAGRLAEARARHDELAGLMAALFVETNPVPLKAALAVLGHSSAAVRSPLAPAEPSTWSLIEAELAALRLPAATPEAVAS